MRTFSALAGAIALAMVAASPAGAADMYASGGLKDPVTGALVPTVTWTGFENGAQVGYGFAGQRYALTATFTDTHSKVYTPDEFSAPDPSGVLGGVHAGYLYQPKGGVFVFGVEADFNGSGISGNANTDLSFGGKPMTTFGVPVGGKPTLLPVVITTEQALDWDSSVRAKLGIATGPVLLYATGGVAFGQINDSINAKFGVTNFSTLTTTYYNAGAHNNGIDVGYAIGAGGEYKVGNWSFGVEYLYKDFGSKAISAVVNDPTKTPTVPVGHVVTNSFDGDFHTVFARLTYHLNSGN
jgi:outer membrane immunogenic protein